MQAQLCVVHRLASQCLHAEVQLCIALVTAQRLLLPFVGGSAAASKKRLLAWLQLHRLVSDEAAHKRIARQTWKLERLLSTAEECDFWSRFVCELDRSSMSLEQLYTLARRHDAILVRFPVPDERHAFYRQVFATRRTKEQTEALLSQRLLDDATQRPHEPMGQS